MLAAVWTVGAFASGPLHLGRIAHPAERPGRPGRSCTPSCSVPVLAGVFVLGGLVVRQIPWLDEQVTTVLDHAPAG